MIYLLGFIASGAVVVLAGTALARYADAIAETTGLGRIWVGSVLLAGATSLPELATDIAAVRLGAPNLAAGDLFGSGLANMLILALIDRLPPRQHVLRQVTFDQALVASLAIGLNAFAAVLVLFQWGAAAFWIGPGSLLLFLAYLAGAHAVYRHAARDGVTIASPSSRAGKSLSARHAGAGFAVAALAILLAAPAFAWSAKGIADVSGLGHTFVGTWLVGLATSLPELVASLAAVRMGAFDLAVGNLFGSNAFNMAIFLPLDLAQPGDFFAVLDPSHAMTGLFAVVLMSLGLAATVYRAKRRFGMLEPGSLLMLGVYLVALWMLFRHSVGG